MRCGDRGYVQSLGAGRTVVCVSKLEELGAHGGFGGCRSRRLERRLSPARGTRQSLSCLHLCGCVIPPLSTTERQEFLRHHVQKDLHSCCVQFPGLGQLEAPVGVCWMRHDLGEAQWLDRFVHACRMAVDRSWDAISGRGFRRETRRLWRMVSECI